MGKNFKVQLLNDLKARVSLFHVQTAELQELREDVEDVARQLNRSLFLYTPDGQLLCQYWHMTEESQIEKAIHSFNKQPRNVQCAMDVFIERLITEPQKRDPSHTSIPNECIILLSGIDSTLDSNLVSQRIIENVVSERFGKNRIALILADTILSLSDKILTYSTPLTFELPTEEELYACMKTELNSFQLDKFKASRKNRKTIPWFCNEDNIHTLVHAMLGMTFYEAKTALRRCLVQQPKSNDLADVLTIIHQQKTDSIEKSNALRIIPSSQLPNREDVGGFDRLLDFVAVRAKAYSVQARQWNIDLPKGVALLGVPGTGKSTAAKAVGKMLGLPVVAMDIGAIFNSYVGVSENRIRQALARIDALDGCVLLIDEADKAFAGATSDTSDDDGVAMRVFGTILNWFQERQSKTFVMITMNNLDALPAELFRAGRFDKVFFAGLPTKEERKNILQAHFRKRGVTVQLTSQDWETILDKTTNYVGAELEAIVQDSRYTAFYLRNDATPTVEEICTAIDERKPLYELKKQAIEQLLARYENVAVPIGY